MASKTQKLKVTSIQETIKNAPQPRSLKRYGDGEIVFALGETKKVIKMETSPQVARNNYFSFKQKIMTNIHEQRKERWAAYESRRLAYEQEILEKDEIIDLEEDLALTDSDAEDEDVEEEDDEANGEKDENENKMEDEEDEDETLERKKIEDSEDEAIDIKETKKAKKDIKKRKCIRVYDSDEEDEVSLAMKIARENYSNDSNATRPSLESVESEESEEEKEEEILPSKKPRKKPKPSQPIEIKMVSEEFFNDEGYTQVRYSKKSVEEKEEKELKTIGNGAVKKETKDKVKTETPAHKKQKTGDAEEGYKGEEKEEEEEEDLAMITDESKEAEAEVVVEEEEEENKENLDSNGETDEEEREVRPSDFFFNEAELSGEGSSDEEEEDGEDELIKELIDEEADKLDGEKIRKDVEKVFRKELENEDKRMLLQLQERYLEDGDLHSDHKRSKKFRWGMASSAWLDNARDSDSSTDEEGREDDDDDDDENAPVFRLKNPYLNPLSSSENKMALSRPRDSLLPKTTLTKPSSSITSYLVRDAHLNDILSTKRSNPFDRNQIIKKLKPESSGTKSLFNLFK